MCVCARTVQYWGHSYTEKLFIIYLKFRFNWESCILSGNPSSRGKGEEEKKASDFKGQFRKPDVAHRQTAPRGMRDKGE